MKISVIGGGIGGLCAAVCLALRGHYIQVFERATAFGEVGAGLQISPNGMRILNEIGVKLSEAFSPEALDMFDAQMGRQIFHLPLAPLRARWGGDYVHVHRAHLLEALLDRAKSLGICLNLGYELSHVEEGRAYFSNGLTADADVIIGADGLHSKVAHYVAPHLQPHYSGYMAWRALVPISKLQTPPPPTASVWKKPHAHIVTTRIEKGETVNFVGISEGEWHGDLIPKSADIKAFCAAFGALNPSLTALVEEVKGFTLWPLMHRETPQTWFKENAVLIGDAAHPMLPSMAQGAVMAIEDAWVLAEVLRGDISVSFMRYQRIRAPRLTHVVKRSFANAKWFHRAGFLRHAEDFLFRYTSRIYPEIIHRQLDKVYKYDVRDEV